MAHSYRSLTQALEDAGIDTPAYEAALLLEAFGGATRASLMTDRDRLYDTPALNEAVSRRLKREPLQYILGEWEFFGCPFTVNEHCLVPRPDTEILVEAAIRLLPPNAHFADLCTGSGCIAVATLVNRPDATADALELYSETLGLACECLIHTGMFFSLRYFANDRILLLKKPVKALCLLLSICFISRRTKSVY